MAEKETKPAKTQAKTTAKATAKPEATAKVEEVAVKPEKVKKEKSAKAAGGGGSAFKTKVAAIVKTDKFKIAGIMAVSLLLVLVLSLSLVFGMLSCKPGYTPVDPINYDYDRFNNDVNFDVGGTADDTGWAGVKSTDITGGYEKGTARATQTSEYIEELSKDEIVKPVEGIRDEHETYGVTQYPYYGRNLKTTVNNRDAIYWESISLIPEPTWRSRGIYNGIDSEGYLLKNGNRIKLTDEVPDLEEGEEGEGGIISGGFEEGEGEEVETGSTVVNQQFKDTYRKLYAHTASITLYGGGLSEDEPRVKKKITAITHMKLASTQITGLYAPAGEVIKVEIPEAEYKAAGGIAVYIGQNYNLDQQVAVEFTSSGVKGNGFTRMTDILSKFELRDKYKNVTIKDGVATAYVGSFLGGPIYFRPINNGAERRLSVTFTGAVKYQHFILGATTKEEYEMNKKSTAPYFDLEVYDSVRFTTHKFASSNGKALKDFTYQDCTDGAILWDKIAEVSTRVGANGLSGASAPVYIIGDCYIAAGAAFANPGRNGVVCPPGWLAEALNYNSFVNSGSWGTMHEYNHCWQGYGVANNGEVTNNATTLVSYSLYTKISAGRTASVGWQSGGWNRFTDPSRALGELLNLGKNGSKRYDLSVYASLLHNIGQDNFVASAQGGGGNGGNYYGRLVNATHYDMSYFFTDVMNFDVGSSYSSGGTIAQSQIDSAKANNYPMFVPVASVYQVGRSVIYDDEKKYVTTAQPYSYGNGEFIMDFNDYNDFKQSGFTHKNLVIPDGITASVVGVTQPENGKVELLDGNRVKYTPTSGEDGLYSGNFRVTLRLIKDDLRFIIEDVDLVINLKQSATTTMEKTTYVYEEGKTPDPASVLKADKTGFDFGEYAETETIKNVCDQDSNSEIWATGRNYYDDTYNSSSKNYKTLPVNQTLQTMEGVMYFSSPCTVRFKLRCRGKTALYLSYDRGQTWQEPLVLERPQSDSGSLGYSVCNDYLEHEFTTTNNAVYYKVVHLVKAEGNYFGIGCSVSKAGGEFSAYAHANVISTSQIDLYEAVNAANAKKFETDYHFKNDYKFNYDKSDIIPVTENKLVSVSHDPWDDTRKIEFLFDGKSDTWYHSKGGAENYITEENPLELVVDLGSLQTVSRVTFYGYNNTLGNNGMVNDFKVYGSTDGQNFDMLLLDVKDAPTNQRDMGANFTPVKIRYYKLVVTDTDNHRYFAMNRIEFSNRQNFTGGKLVAPNDFNVRYIGNSWTTENVLSNFGLIYKANAGDSVEFHFTGSRFAYFADRSSDYGTVNIYIDGKVVAENVDLSANNYAGASYSVADYFNVAGISDPLAYIYTGDALDSTKEHTVKIVGKSGQFNLSGFAYWN